MRRLVLWSGFTLLVFWTLGCSSVAVTHDANISRERYQVYQWVDNASAQKLKLSSPDTGYITSSVSIELIPEEAEPIRQTLDRELKKVGYLKDPMREPDFYVTFYLKPPGEQWFSTWQGVTEGIIRDLYKVPVILFPRFNRGDVANYREKSLMVVIYDSKTKHPVWSAQVLDAVPPDFSQKFSPDLNQRLLEVIQRFHAS